MNNVKTRFAPSPTGYLHIGGLRTALYAFLFARKNEGKLLLRIEDTDRTRYIEGAAEALVDVLEKVGISIDEGPIAQSDRLDIYKGYVDQLVEAGKAYPCFCTKERLDEVRKQQQLAKMQTKYDRTCLKLSEEERKAKIEAGDEHVIRMHIPEGETVFTDIIRGVIKIENIQIDDQVILKSDGYPTYHLAVVVDDHEMGITHIIRGEEWISSVPKHVILYEAFGWDVPEMAHLPLILNPDKSKLSKRQGDVAVEDFLKKGYLPEALINFVALLGWNPKGDQEIYTLEELQASFDLTKVNKGGAVFNTEKLDWMNGEYIKALSVEALMSRLKPFIDHEVSEEDLEKIVTVEQGRLNRLTELNDKLVTYLELPDYSSELLVWKKSDAADAKAQLEALLTSVESMDAHLGLDEIEAYIKGYIGENDLQMGNVLWPLRVALSGLEKSASPFELFWVHGKEEAMRRIGIAISKL